MAPAQSKLSQPGTSGPRKRKPSAKITDENFVGAESNAVTKRLKLSAAAPQAKTVKRQPRQASVEDIEDEDSTSVNNPPRNPNALLEAANGGDDDVETEDDPAPALEEVEPYGDDDDDDEEPEITESVETAEAQRGQSKKYHTNLFHVISPLDRLSVDWMSPIYAFFHPTPSIVNVDGRRVHEFRCSASNCKGRGKNPRIVRRYLDTSDRNSTGNLRKHARQCWGDEVLLGADTCGDIETTREALGKAKKQIDGSITTIQEEGKRKDYLFSSSTR